MLCYTDPKWDTNKVVLDAIERVIKIFGVDRCMVASNHPADWHSGWTAEKNYRAFSTLFTRMGLGQIHQSKLFSENAKRVVTMML